MFKQVNRSVCFLALCLVGCFSSIVLIAQDIDNSEIIKNDSLANALARTQVDQAYQLAEANFAQIDQISDAFLKAKVIYTFGLLQHFKGNQVDALENLLSASYTFAELNKYDLLIETYNLIGGIYYVIGEYDRTIYYTEIALDIAEIQGLEQEKAVLFNNLSGAYRQLYDYQNAFYFARKSYDLAEEPIDKLYVNSTLADIFLDQQLYDSAIAYYNKAVEIGQSENLLFDFNICFLEIGLARSFYGKGDSIKAYEMINNAYKIAESNGFISEQKMAAELLATIWRKRDNQDSTFFYQSKYLALEDTLWSLEESVQLTRIELKHREDEISQQKAINERQKLYMLAGIVVGLLLLAITGILIYANYRKRMLLNKLNLQKDTIETFNKQLSEQKKELQELHQLKDKMFSMVVHDFKTPINTLENMLNLIIGGHLTPEEAERLAIGMLEYVKRSKSSIDNLIVWFRKQMEGLEVSKKEFQLHDLVSNVIEYHQPLLNRKSIQASIDIPEEMQLKSDPEILKVILNNLVSNAIKYTQTEGRIEVCAKKEDHTVLLSVRDNGVGFENNILKSAFQLSNERTDGTNSEKGTGIGLVICKELVTRLKGTIEVQSTKGEGTTVLVKLPVS